MSDFEKALRLAAQWFGLVPGRRRREPPSVRTLVLLGGLPFVVGTLVVLNTAQGTVLHVISVGAWGAGGGVLLSGLLQRWKARRAHAEPRPNSRT